MIVRGTLAKYIGPGITVIETGTRDGDTVAVALEIGAEGVMSIENQHILYEKAIKRFQNEKRVGLYFGDSVEILPKLLPVAGRAMFWLDAHSTGMTSPILGELGCISAAYKNSPPGFLPTILIDDVRCYRKAEWGVRLGQVVDAVMDISPHYHMAVEDGYAPGDVLVFKGTP